MNWVNGFPNAYRLNKNEKVGGIALHNVYSITSKFFPIANTMFLSHEINFFLALVTQNLKMFGQYLCSYRYMLNIMLNETALQRHTLSFFYSIMKF